MWLRSAKKYLQKLDLDGLDPQRKGGHGELSQASAGSSDCGADIFDMAAYFSSTEFDPNCGDEASAAGNSLLSDQEYIPEVEGSETKLEEVLMS